MQALSRFGAFAEWLRRPRYAEAALGPNLTQTPGFRAQDIWGFIVQRKSREQLHAARNAARFTEKPATNNGPRGEGLLIAPAVRWVIDCTGGWDAVRARFSRTIRNRVRRDIQFEIEMRTDPDSLRRFYVETYLPFIRRRHGEAAWRTPYWLLRAYLRNGYLELYRLGETPIGGLLVSRDREGVSWLAIGLSPACDEHQYRSLMIFNYRRLLRQACQAGPGRVDLGRTRPLLNDGVARHKRAWGAALTWSGPHARCLLLQAGSASPQATRAFLRGDYWIGLEAGGDLVGVSAFDDGDDLSAELLNREVRRLWAPGVQRVYVYSGGIWPHGIELADGPFPSLGPAAVWRPNAAG